MAMLACLQELETVLGSESEMEMLYLGRRFGGGQDAEQQPEQPPAQPQQQQQEAETLQPGPRPGPHAAAAATADHEETEDEAEAHSAAGADADEPRRHSAEVRGSDNTQTVVDVEHGGAASAREA